MKQECQNNPEQDCREWEALGEVFELRLGTTPVSSQPAPRRVPNKDETEGGFGKKETMCRGRRILNNRPEEVSGRPRV